MLISISACSKMRGMFNSLLLMLFGFDSSSRFGVFYIAKLIFLAICVHRKNVE